MRVRLGLLLGLCVFFLPCISLSRAQTDGSTPLPADLLFTTLTGDTPFFTTLMRVDAQTLQTSPFYVDAGVYIRPLSWSPTEDLLAILRLPSTDVDYFEVCLVTAEGVLKACFEDKITVHGFRERGQNYTVTWSEDGRNLYFVTDYDLFHWNEGTSDEWGACLVEAEVSTGQTWQTIYQTQVIAHYPPPILSWTNDLHYLLVSQWPPITIDLWENVEFMLPQELPDLGQLEFCDQFSPQGQYLTARAYVNDELAGWVLVSPGGQIVQTVNSEQLQQVGIDWMECPVWQSDEAAFYFLGGKDKSTSLFKYVLAANAFVNVKQLYPSDSQYIPLSPISLAPDNATLAITFGIPGSSATEIHVLTPDNEWLTYGGEEMSVPIGENPVWFPSSE